MNLNRSFIVLMLCCIVGGLLQGCTQPPPQYGSERKLYWPDSKRQIFAVAPAINLSGHKEVDPLLQADLVYQQLQQVQGVTVIPVNRVAEVYASLQIEKVQSEQQAALVCDLLGCDGLVVPTVTAYDPFNPPKFGAALQLFTQAGTYARPAAVDVRQLVRSANPGTNDSVPHPAGFLQAVGMFDAADGSVRQAVIDYADGRNNPQGPLGNKEYFVSMDRYCGFVYFSLINELISQSGR